MRENREKSDPIYNMANVIKKMGYNKDVILSMAVVTNLSPLTVKLKGNDLETTNLKPMAHLMPQYHPVHLIFNDELGNRSGTMMIDNGLEIDDLVYVIYDIERNVVNGFIIGKEE